ncbi:MAG: hypothetical protein MJ231_03755, partial [bacterium]|nr:hypothetical protein [bacterium]
LMAKVAQQMYQSCIKYDQVAINAYKRGKCKRLTVNKYTDGSKRCEDKYLNGKKIFGGCVDEHNRITGRTSL